MESVVKRCGRFTLIRTEQGFCWLLATRGGEHWYWHPETRQWTAVFRGSPTEEGATAELDWTLSHERAGDLNEQHAAPPLDHLSPYA